MSENTPTPPQSRGPLWRFITEGARAGELRLQHCRDCGQVQYPPREICGRCLSAALVWRNTRAAGWVLSATTLYASLEPYFQARLPVQVALVELEAGPVAYALADQAFNKGDPVTLEARIEQQGEAVLWATPAAPSGDA